MIDLLLVLVIAATILGAGVGLGEFVRWLDQTFGPAWTVLFVAALCAAGVVSLAVFG